MARIRTIKPEFWKHEDLSELPEATHMLAAALLNHADDEGYFNANPALVRSECLPLRESSVSVNDSLNHLARVGYIRLGKGQDGKRYGRIVKFADHQRVNRPTPSKIKAIAIEWEGSCDKHGGLTEPSLPEGKGKEQGREGNGTSSLRSESSSAAPIDPPPPADLPARQAERLAQVTDEAIAAYNASPLVKTNGGALSNVSPTVGRERRQKEVNRCLRVARQISVETYNAQRVPYQFWVDYFQACSEDEFHAGRTQPGRGHENWKPDFEYLTQEKTMLKVYDRAADEGAAA